jgi:hypothetical protein
VVSIGGVVCRRADLSKRHETIAAPLLAGAAISIAERIMTEITGESPDVRDLESAEIFEVAGGFNNIGPLMAAAGQVLRFIDDINLQFYGCETQGGTTRCVYSYEP